MTHSTSFAVALAATPYVETTLILLLHILGAMATVGGVLGMLGLYIRAATSIDAAALKVSALTIDAFNRRLLQPAAGVTGVVGLLLALRYNSRNLFDVDKQVWMIISILLWVAVLGIGGTTARVIRAAVADINDSDEIEAARLRLATSGAALRLAAMTVLLLAITYLMVFRPFVLT